MKKIFLFLAFTLGLVACGNAKQQDTLLAHNDASNPAVFSQQAKEYTLTDRGIGPIVLGMNVKDIPQTVPGLYDRVEKVSTPDGEEYQFFMGETPLFTASDADEGIISGIGLFNESPIKIKTSSGNDYISL